MLFRFVEIFVIAVSSLMEIGSSGMPGSAVGRSVSLAFPLPSGLGLGRALGAGAG